ncbi:cytochrome P450 [Aspergillus alliaceus]|uniref:cytochrome P450 n=1 Tax=Petromyces alliaceus TaxID=209559 RepID=UPI0012A6ED48|nr:benzoate 4-monooxygenase cytochrome P450 [Aspergillus alliaceus]KAB8233940.1 benzoate 4-monooxygenase cytochrome P450 [Aspergillus alliaceus]
MDIRTESREVTLSSVGARLFLFAIGFVICKAVYNIYFHPLRKFPGPLLAACSPLYYFYWLYTGKLYYAIKESHDKYGDVVRFSPNMLVYRKTQVWQEVYGYHKNGTTFTKDPGFYPRNPSGHTMISTPYEAEHSSIRHALSPAFSQTNIMGKEPVLQQNVQLLLDQLEGFADSRTSVDITKWYNYTTFDIVGDLAFSESFNCLRGSNHQWIDAIFRGMRIFVFIRPFLSLPTFILNGLLSYVSDESFTLIKKKIDQRLKLEPSRPDFLSHLLGHDKNNEISKVEANAGVLVVAGSETTATLLSGCTFYLLTHPLVYEKLANEIRGAFDYEDEITLLALGKLPYLQAVLEESLRMYPPVPAILPRTVPKGGAAVNGEFVPEGTSVTMAIFSAFRSPSEFTDPDSFIPERWLKDSPYKCQKEALQPFSYGPRNCIGKVLAYAEMRLILARLLWKYDMKIDDESYNWNDQIAYTVWVKKPLMVHLSPINR